MRASRLQDIDGTNHDRRGGDHCRIGDIRADLWADDDAYGDTEELHSEQNPRPGLIEPTILEPARHEATHVEHRHGVNKDNGKDDGNVPPLGR
jgi:hypothetical protein